MKLILIINLICLFALVGCTDNKPSYTVTFYDGSGNEIKSQMIKEGKDAIAPDTPIIPNTVEYSYQFTGWNKDFTNITSDLKVYPTYKQEINRYTYTFLDYDDSVLKEVNAYYGSLIIPPKLTPRNAPVNSRYDFVSWGKTVGHLTGDVTFKAEYKLVKYYTLSIYGPSFEDIINTIMVDEGNLPLVPAIPKVDKVEGMYHRFLGWYTDKTEGELFDFTKMLNKDVAIYPRFEVEPFRLFQKKISLLGDSITTYYSKDSPLNSSFQGLYEYYYPNPNTDVKTVNQTWWYTMLSKTETNLGLNNSRGGAKVYNGGNENDLTAGMNYARINDLDNNGNPDIIVIYMGTNDYVTDVTEQAFKSSYNTMLNRIYEVYPNVDVFMCTIQSPGSAYAPAFRERWTRFNEIIRNISSTRNIPLIEFDKAITDSNHSSNTSDALHPNVNGMLLLGNKAAEEIKRYYGLIS